MLSIDYSFVYEFATITRIALQEFYLFCIAKFLTKITSIVMLSYIITLLGKNKG